MARLILFLSLLIFAFLLIPNMTSRADNSVLPPGAPHLRCLVSGGLALISLPVGGTGKGRQAYTEYT
jgi:hypothetical protein